MARVSATAAQLREQFAAQVPTSLHHERSLAVLEPLQPLFATGGLLRGHTVSVQAAGCGGARSLALAVAAGPVAAGSWVAAVGLPTLGLCAAAECGVDLRRLVLVDTPPADRWAEVLAALVGGVDLIVAAPPPLTAADGRRLAARLRERGTSLVVVGEAHRRSALGADETLRVEAVRWSGVGRGHGHLRARRLEVVASGRGRAARVRRMALWLPDADGQITRAAPVPEPAVVLRHPSGGAG
ncbi:MAG: hypothetical protein JJU45_16040 [Acidimicrobiia bacterium]|nr:hypothetical protein [Acidimicrobiia bacterium]